MWAGSNFYYSRGWGSIWLSRNWERRAQSGADGVKNAAATTPGVATARNMELRDSEHAVMFGGGLEAAFDLCPVHHVPPGLDIVSLDVQVVQVKSVLPHIQHE